MVQKTTVATKQISSIMIIDYCVFIYIVSKSPILQKRGGNFLVMKCNLLQTNVQ